MTGSAGGSALGTLVGGLIADLTMMLHLLRKSNAVVPKWTLSLRALRELASYSMTDASARLCQCGFMAVLNRLVLGKGVGGDVVSKIMLLVEECAMTVVDDKGGCRGVLSEISFIVSNEETQMFIRDTGRLRDITDDEARVASLRSFVVSGLMRSYENRRYLATIGCNRAAFSFRTAVVGLRHPDGK